MKFVAVVVFVAFILADGVDSASVSLSSSQLTLNGHRFPIINSGDYITLRLAYTSGSNANYWLYCAHTCAKYSCPGTIMTSSAWSSCSTYMMFKITAKGKMDGQPIDSGDTVSLSSKASGTGYRLYCATSSSYKCVVTTGAGSTMTGNSWLSNNWFTFQIFSRNAVDGTPVQYGDIVGFKYPYSSYSAWLTYYNGYYSPRSCSNYVKTSCAAQNNPSGFQIFKQL